MIGDDQVEWVFVMDGLFNFRQRFVSRERYLTTNAEVPEDAFHQMAVGIVVIDDQHAAELRPVTKSYRGSFIGHGQLQSQGESTAPAYFACSTQVAAHHDRQPF